jgi:hypothetical protein
VKWLIERHDPAIDKSIYKYYGTDAIRLISYASDIATTIEGRSLLGVLLSSERSVYFYKSFNFRSVFSFLVVIHDRNNCFAVINNPVTRSILRNAMTALTALKSLMYIPPLALWHCIRANFNDVKNSRMLTQ